MAEKKKDKDKKVDAGIATLASVINFITTNKESIVKAASDLNTIVETISSGAGALNPNNAENVQKFIVQLGDIAKVIRADFPKNSEISLKNFTEFTSEFYNAIKIVSDKYNSNRAALETFNTALSSILVVISTLNSLTIRQMLSAMNKTSIMKGVLVKYHEILVLMYDMVNDRRSNINRAQMAQLTSGFKMIRAAMKNMSGAIEDAKEIGRAGIATRLLLWNAKMITESMSAMISAMMDMAKGYSSARFAKLIVSLILFEGALDAYNNVLMAIKAVNRPLFYKVRLNRIYGTIEPLQALIAALQELVSSTNRTRLNAMISSFIVMTIVIGEYGEVLRAIRTTPSWLIKGKVKRLSKISDEMEKMMQTLTKLTTIKGLNKVTSTMKQIHTIFSSLRSTLVAIMVVSTVGLVFIAAAPLIIAVLWLLFKVMKVVIIVATQSLAGPRMLVTMIALAGTFLAFTAIAGALILLAVAAIPAIMAMPIVVLFMGGLIALMAVFLLFGYVASLVAPFFPIIGIAIVAIGVAVLAILAIALMLWLLQVIELDIEKIKENVQKILSVASQIIFWVTEPVGNDDILDRERGMNKVDSGVWVIMGSMYRKIFGAVAGAIALVGIVIAVAAVLLIAVFLRLLQNLDLDFYKIQENVRMVFDVSNWILDYITTPTWVDSREDGHKDAVTTVCGFVYEPLLKVIDSIAGAAGLIVMIFGVLAILLIATALRLIQNLDLDENQILGNVDFVFEICDKIIKRILAPDKESDASSNRGIVSNLLSWVYEPLNPVLDSIFTMAYLAVMVIAILGVLLIATMLRLLQNLDLDGDKIMENVDMVLSTTQHIIDNIFNPDREDSSKSNRGILSALLGWIYKPIVPMLDSIFAMAYLAVITISILCVLAIAGLLRLLQNIDLDHEKIRENVKEVIDTCRLVIDSILSPDTENSDKSERGGIKEFFSWVASGFGIGKVFDAILSMAYLAVMTISILCVLGMAKMLEWVAAIDPSVLEQAKNNALLVTQVCGDIIDTIFKSDEASKEQSDRGMLRDFISWVSEDFGKIYDAVLTISYLALMMISMTIVLGLVKVMEQIGQIDKSIMENASSNVDIVMNTMNNIVNKVYDGEDNGSKASNRGILLKIVEWVAGKKVADVMSAILTINHLALMFFAVYIVGAMAKSLETIGGIDRDIMLRARDNVDLVLSTAYYVMDKLINSDFHLPEAKADNNMEKLLKWLMPSQLHSMIASIMTIASLAFSELMIGSLAHIAENLNKVSEIDVANVGAAQTKAVSILSSASKILTHLMTNVKGVIADADDLKDLTKIIKNLGDTLNSIVSISVGMKRLAEMPDFDTQKAYDTTIDIFKMSMALMDYIANGEDAVEDLSFFGGWSKHFKKSNQLAQLSGIIKETQNIMNMMSKFLTATRAVGEKIPEIQSLEFDAMTALEKMKSIWNMVDSMIIKQMEFYKIDTKNIGTLASMIRHEANAINQMSAVMAAVSILYKNIHAVSTWLPVLESIQYSSSIETNIQSLFAGLNRMMRYTADSESSSSWSTVTSYLRSEIRAIAAAAEVMTSYSSLMPRLQEAFNSVIDLSIDENSLNINATRAKNSLNHMHQIIDAASFQTKESMVRKNMDLMDRIDESIKSFTHITGQDVKNSKDLTDNYIAFLTRVNRMDYNKLKTTEQLMKHWADMSRTINGNFQGLAQAINGHIMPAMQTLNKTMDNVVKVQKEIIEELRKPLDLPNTSPSDTEKKYYKQEGKKFVEVDQTGSKIDGGKTWDTSDAAMAEGYQEVGDAPQYIQDDWDDNNTTRSRRDVPEQDFLHPYPVVRPSHKPNSLDRCIDGDALRVKIVN